MKNDRICFYTPPYAYVKSYRTLIDCTAAHGLSYLEGFSHFELARPDLNAARAIKAYADEKHVRFSCFSVFSDLVGDRAAETVEMLKGYADVCAVLECPYLHHTIVPNCFDPDAVLPHYEEYYRQGIELVRQVYDYAEKRNVRTVYEDQGYIFNGVNGFGRFLKEVERDVGVVADFGNVYQVGETAEAFTDAFRDRICHVHVKNVTIREQNDTGSGLKTLQGKYMFAAALEDGDADCRKLIADLQANGYSGCYSLEFSAQNDDPHEMTVRIEQLMNWITAKE